jgi:hypothetical protein
MFQTVLPASKIYRQRELKRGLEKCLRITPSSRHPQIIAVTDRQAFMDIEYKQPVGVDMGVDHGRDSPVVSRSES